MATKRIATSVARKKRHRRIRSRLSGTNTRPRLAVFRSHKHIVAQLIDDAAGHTLLFVSDRDLQGKAKKPKDVASAVGELFAQRAKAAGITEALFDRGGFSYHGRIRAFAEGARKAGLTF